MKTFSRAVSIIADIVTYMAVILVFIFAGLLFFPRLAGVSPYIVMSGSMEPMIQTGSMVYIAQMSDKEDPVVKGDIMAYMAGDGMPVVHRVYSTDGGYVMKGDANDVPDAGIVDYSQFIGEYRFSIPKLGYLMANLEAHTIKVGGFELPVAVPIFIGIVVMLQVLAYFISFLSACRKDRIS